MSSKFVGQFDGARAGEDLRDQPQPFQQVRKIDVLGVLVDDQPHRPLVRVRAPVDDGALEAAVRHTRHGDQKLPLERGPAFAVSGR